LSHTPQRKEKDGLNWSATVQGRYCHVCGQENVEIKKTLWHMVTNFFHDITHIDGTFFCYAERPAFFSRQPLNTLV
jgi:hypothetical protein